MSSLSPPKRIRVGPRTQVACLACKTRKQKCHPMGSACRNCIKAGRPCIIEDPTTKRCQPRGYLQSLEERVALLEGLLNDAHPQLSLDHLYNNQQPTGPQTTEREFGNTLDVFSDGEGSVGDHLTSASSALFETSEQSISSTSMPASMNGPAATCSSNHPGTSSEAEDDLSSEIGLLCLNAAGQGPLHYFGSSSSFSFSRIIFSSLRRVRSQGPGFSMGGIRDRNIFELPSAVPAPLPPREVGRILSNAYFHNIHPQYPILHRPTFDMWENHVMTARENAMVPDAVPNFFVNMVFAVGTLILPTSLDSPAECFYAAAQEHIGAVIQRDGLESVQAILCCAMYSLRSHIGVSVWSLSGLALRQCIELGYHRNPQRFRAKQNPLQLEMQRRVFWISYSLDRCAAVTLGRPFGIADKDIDVDLPSDINDEMINSEGLLAVPRCLPTEVPTSMSAAIHTINLRRIWSRIQEELYPSNSICSSELNTEVLIAGFKSELKQWLESTPATMPMSAVFSTFSTREWFELAYNHSILLLYRRLLATDRHGKLTANYLECCHAARDICNLYRKLFLTNPISYTWGALHILFLAGLTYLHCLITSPGVRASLGQDEISKTCTACTIVLVIMAERWKAAAAYRDTFEMLSSTTISMLVKAGASPSVNMTGEGNTNAGWLGSLLMPIVGGTDNQLQRQEMTGYLEDIAEIGMCSGTEELLSQFIGSV